jgi:predicted HNH restriction endonuclease
MSRVEITQNKGPEVITSIDQTVNDGTSNLYSDAVNVRLYTLHSYQVITDQDITVTIIGSNYTDPNTSTASKDFASHWTTISTHNVTSTGLAYSDIWNFKYSCVLVANNSGNAANVKVLEKHNA